MTKPINILHLHNIQWYNCLPHLHLKLPCFPCSKLELSLRNSFFFLKSSIFFSRTERSSALGQTNNNGVVSPNPPS